jgi:rRNA-processing protein FCF1
MAFNRLRGNPEKTVILDSNAILMLFEFSLDLESELIRLLGKYKIIIPSPIVEELNFLSEKDKGQKGMNAKAALELIEKYDIFKIDAKTADEAVLITAKTTNGIVVTNDKELRQKLKELSIRVIFLKGKKTLELN